MRKSAARRALDLLFAIDPHCQGSRPCDSTMCARGWMVQTSHLHILSSTRRLNLVIWAHAVDTAVVALMSPPAASFAEICVYHGGDAEEQRTKCCR